MGRKVISWDEYFMGIAELSAMRSKDPRTQVGACIVNEDKRIDSIGYNGMPYGSNDEDMPWGNENTDPNETKYPYVVHAELNAILNGNGRNLKGDSLYVTMFPCCECAKAIAQVGIKKVYYKDDKYMTAITGKAAQRILKNAGVELIHYKAGETS